MSCEELEERIALLVSGDLAPSDRAAIESHLAGCAVCGARLREFEEERRALHALRDDRVNEADGAAVRQQVLARIADQQRAGWRTWWPAWLRPVPVAVAALAVLTLGIWWLNGTQPAKSLPPAAPKAGAASVAALPDEPSSTGILPVGPTAKMAPLRASTRRHAVVAVSGPPLQARTKSDDLAIRFETADPNVVILWFVSPSEGGQQ